MASPKVRQVSITPEQFAAAQVRGRALTQEHPLAVAAGYRAGRVHVELNNGCAFVFPVGMAQGLANAKPTELRDVHVSGAGLGLHWPQLDADLFVPALVAGMLGTREWMAQLGRKGGQVRSPAKVAASRDNGKLGGRPRSKVPQAA